MESLPAPIGYREAYRRFPRNARLYLAYASMSGINDTIFLVAFALYLVQLFVSGGPVILLGFSVNPIVFVGMVLGAEGLAHGLNSIPSGFIGDRFGRKKSFIAATLVGATAAALTVLTGNPLLLLVLSAANGIGNSFHGVMGGPFLMENSEPAERMHLFTLSSVLGTVSNVFGAVAALGLVLFFQHWTGTINPSALGPLGFPPTSALPLRLTLFLAALFGVAELVPVALMRERYRPSKARLKDIFLLRQVRHKPTLGKLFLLAALYSVGLGLFLPLLAVYLKGTFEADAVSYSPLIAVSSMTVAAVALLMPSIVRRVGKVRAIAFLRVGSAPVLLSMAFLPGLGPVAWAFAVFAVLFIARGAISDIAGPAIGSFSMETMDPPERATTAGFTHFAFDFLYGFGPLAGGFLLAGGHYWVAFVAAGSLVLVHGLLWLVFFGGYPSPLLRGAAIPAPDMSTEVK